MTKLFDVSFFLGAFPKLAHELPMTLFVASVSCVLGLLLGTLVTFVNVRRVPVLSQLGRVYISFIRGTPAVVQIFLCFFLLPALFRLFGVQTKDVPLVLYALAACSLHLGGYAAETLRGALLAIGTDQLEAAYAVGMGTGQAYSRILFPQAFAAALPDLSGQVIGTLKNTSLLFNIGLVDIMTRAKLIGGGAQRNLEVYLAAGILYIGLCLLVHLLFHILEERVRVRKYGQ